MTPRRCRWSPDVPGGRARLARVLPLALLASLVAGGALAGAPASLQITQALARGTEVTAYVAVRDESGAPVTAEALGQARATLGTQVAEVASATPLRRDGRRGALRLAGRSVALSGRGPVRAYSPGAARLDRRPGGPDRAAILTFGNQVHTLVAPTADRAALTAALDGLKPTDDRTALHQALAQGLTLGRQQGPDLPSRRALVILSDGRDDAPGGMTAEEVEMQMAEGTVPIHAIGFSRIRERAAREAGLTALGRLARRSGGALHRRQCWRSGAGLRRDARAHSRRGAAANPVSDLRGGWQSLSPANRFNPGGAHPERWGGCPALSPGCGGALPRHAWGS
jgi:hypothetical protein